jgi:hypothetical protein
MKDLNEIFATPKDRAKLLTVLISAKANLLHDIELYKDLDMSTEFDEERLSYVERWVREL